MKSHIYSSRVLLYAADPAHSVEVAVGWQLAQEPGSPDYFLEVVFADCRQVTNITDMFHVLDLISTGFFFSMQYWSFHQQRLGPELDTNPTKGKTHFVHALFRLAALHFLRMHNPRYTTTTYNWSTQRGFSSRPSHANRKKWIAYGCFQKISVVISITDRHRFGSYERFRFWSALMMRGEVLVSFASSHTQKQSALWAS